jgi:hypothetical protein
MDDHPKGEEPQRQNEEPQAENQSTDSLDLGGGAFPDKNKTTRRWLFICVAIVGATIAAIVWLSVANNSQTITDHTEKYLGKSSGTKIKGVTKVYVADNGSYKLSSGDTICFTSYFYGSKCQIEQLRSGAIPEPNATGYMSLDPGAWYVFQRAGIQTTLSYKKDECTTEPYQLEDYKGTRVTGCSFYIKEEKMPSEYKPTDFTKDLTLGEGIYIENNSMYGEATGTRDPNRSSVPPLFSANPLVYASMSNAHDQSDNSSYFFKDIFVSKRCENKVACSHDMGENSDGSLKSTNLKLHFATQRGYGSVLFSPTEIYQKKTKVSDLDHAVISVGVAGYSYSGDDCEYYGPPPKNCQPDPNGTLYDRVQFKVNYKEASY